MYVCILAGRCLGINTDIFSLSNLGLKQQVKLPPEPQIETKKEQPSTAIIGRGIRRSGVADDSLCLIRTVDQLIALNGQVRGRDVGIAGEECRLRNRISTAWNKEKMSLLLEKG